MRPMTLKSFDDRLLQDLRDPEFAAAYLNDALEDSVAEFLIALRKYVQANGGMSAVAARAHIAREALYRMLSGTGNPEFRSIHAILQAGGLGIGVTPAATPPRDLAA